MKLVAFDGDNTLWRPINGINLSDRTPTDDEGWPHFTYKLCFGEPLTVQRDDGVRFKLRPEAREVMEELKRRGVLVGVISYNHQANVRRVLDAFGLLPLVDYIVAEWHTNKDQMLAKMIDVAHRDGHEISPAGVLLVDDDPENVYRGQCERMGICFSRFGTDITNLREVYNLLVPAGGEGDR